MSSMPTIAIAGNPNSGKTTAFNRYTGARQHVGNYPGITVDKKDGIATVEGQNILLVDLPGTYSLTAYSQEEVVARKMLTDERPGAVLDIINAGVLERNLYLAVQLLELGIPTVLALNMMDEAKKRGITIDIERLSTLMQLPVFSTVARTGEGLDEALLASVKLAETTKGKPWTPLQISYGTDIDAAIAEMMPIIEEAGMLTDVYPSRWIALKLLESDEHIIGQSKNADLQTYEKLKVVCDKLNQHLDVTLATYPEAVISDHRYGYISSILRQGVVTTASDQRDRLQFSDKLDKILTNRFLGPIIMVVVLYAMYLITFNIGEYPAGWVESFFEWLRGTAEAGMADGLLKSLVISGVIDGVGGVFGFIPLIIIMFLLISFLEDSGYMARVAYMLDRIFKMFGLHGSSVMPFIISGGIAGGCAVPGIMAARTLRSPKERLATILTAPFMACGAKLPVFLLIVGVFFESNQAAVMLALTIAGWVVALLVSRLLRSTIIRGESTPFVMELPPYRMPTFRGIIIHTWERAWQYIKKAGTIILAISIILWAAMTFPGLPDAESEKFAAEKAPYEEQFTALPAGSLQARIDEISAALEESGSDATLQAQLAELEEQKEAFPYFSLTAQLEELEGQLEEAGEGPEAEALQAKIDELTEQLEALPEAELLGKIEEIDQRESAAALRNSVGGRIGIALEGISKPAGFDWRTNIALVGGIAAKEVVISTLGTAYSLGEVDPEESGSLAERISTDPDWTVANGVSLLLFTLLYSPCFVALVVIKQESGKWRWLAFSLVFNLLLAYLVSVAAYQLLS